MTTVPQLRDGEQKIFFQTGGEWCYLWTPRSFLKNRPVPLVIHHHGARGYVKEGRADWLEEESKVAYLNAVMAGGNCAVAGSNACGDHWGNTKAVAANNTLFETLIRNPHIDARRIGLMGGGLGGALIWNSILGPLGGHVKAVVVMQAVASLEAVIREHKFKAPCLKAYGLQEDTEDDEAVRWTAPNDPLPRLQKLPIGAPLPRTAIYHGVRDDNILAKTNAIPLAEALKRARAHVTLELFPDVTHSVYAVGKPIEERLKSFFASSL